MILILLLLLIVIITYIIFIRGSYSAPFKYEDTTSKNTIYIYEKNDILTHDKMHLRKLYGDFFIISEYGELIGLLNNSEVFSYLHKYKIEKAYYEIEDKNKFETLKSAVTLKTFLIGKNDIKCLFFINNLNFNVLDLVFPDSNLGKDIVKNKFLNNFVVNGTQTYLGTSVFTYHPDDLTEFIKDPNFICNNYTRIKDNRYYNLLNEHKKLYEIFKNEMIDEYTIYNYFHNMISMDPVKFEEWCNIMSLEYYRLPYSDNIKTGTTQGGKFLNNYYFNKSFDILKNDKSIYKVISSIMYIYEALLIQTFIAAKLGIKGSETFDKITYFITYYETVNNISLLLKTPSKLFKKTSELSYII